MAGFDLATYLMTGKKMRRGSTWLTGADPCAAIYRTKDNEYITLEVMEPAFWVKFCNAIERPDLIPNQWLRDDEAREEMFSILREIFLTKTKYEWWEWARENEIMLAPVQYIEEAVDDPQLRHRKMIIEQQHPTLGKILQLGNPLKLSDTPPKPVKAYSPYPGQHTEMILKELNFNKRQIEALKKQGAVE
jgi:crotonobetainyl-CoA:carnitine CoA-transferase CaiB-like acyl-CoA transferase